MPQASPPPVPRPHKSRSASPTWLTIVLLLAAALLVVREMRGPGSAHGQWIDGWERGLAAAQEARRPFVALFTADWCPACRTLNKEALSDAGVKAAMSDFTLVKVDLSHQGAPGTEAARQYDVRSIPTMILFDAEGRQVDRIVGAPPAAELVRWLDGRRELALRGR
jgi:thiol:disulfide interchange protein